MPAKDKKITEELERAFKTEIAGHIFYTAAAAFVTDNKGKNVFTHLAKEELEHIKVVYSIAEYVKKGHGWPTYEGALKAGSGAVKDGLPIFPGSDELVVRLRKNQTDLNAVKIALQSEEEAVDFYSGLLNDAKTPAEKVTLTKLLEMEKGHLKTLRWESESLLKTGFWCGEMEYSVEKESD